MRGSAALPGLRSGMYTTATSEDYWDSRIEAGDREEIAVAVHKLPPLHSDESAVLWQDSQICYDHDYQQPRCDASQGVTSPHAVTGGPQDSVGVDGTHSR